MSVDIDICKHFPKLDIHFTLQADHERVGLLGASGCGKSTILRMISGVETPDQGHIIVDGNVFFDAQKHINMTPQSRKTALLFQNYQLFPNMSVFDNVCAGIVQNDTTQKAQAAHKALELFSMDEYANDYPFQLSGGQKQRVALARMIAAKPSYFMFDEPFSALDSYLKSSFEQQLLDMLDEINAPVLFVSHNIDEALRFCDKVCILDQGSVVEFGRPQELFAHPMHLATLKLSGCKNISCATYIDEHHLHADDWGIDMYSPHVLDPALKYVGIRAFRIRKAQDTSDASNIFHATVYRVSSTRFEHTIMLELTDTGAKLQWKLGRMEQETYPPRVGEHIDIELSGNYLDVVANN